METTLRNATLDKLAELLKEQHAAKVDTVVPSNQLRFKGGRVQFTLPEPEITEHGVLSIVTLDPTPEMIGDIASRADIPVRYLRRLYSEGWFAEHPAGEREPIKRSLIQNPDYPAGRIFRGDATDLLDITLLHHFREMDKKLLIRGFRGPDGIGTGRALLSNSYRAIDHLDVLMAALEGVNASGVEATVTQCNLSPRNMRVRFLAPAVQEMAPELLKGYRTPWERDGSGYGTEGLRDGDGNLPVISAGFEISNSETGSGSAKITPVLNVRICNNGLVINTLAKAHRHTGGKLEDGTINWAADTQRKAVELITAQTRDMVTTFLSKDFLVSQIDALTAKAGKPVDKPKETIERIGKALSWTDAEQDTILSMFIKGGQSTSGGVMQAVTAAAQVIGEPDRAFEIESGGIRAMELV